MAVGLVDHLEPALDSVLVPAVAADGEQEHENGPQNLRRFGGSVLGPRLTTDGEQGHENGTPIGAVVAGIVLVALLGVGAVGLVRLATAGEGDYHRLARQARADGVAPTKVLVYGEAVAPYFPGAYDSLAPFDDGQTPAQLVVLDPSLTDAVDGATVARWRDWARSWGLQPHRVGRLEGWWAAP